MANHVHFAVEFHQMNDAAKEKLKELYSRVRTDGTYRWFGDIFVDGEELTYEQSEMYEWTTDQIGPKWCYLEDYDEDGFNGEAAWSPPTDGVVKLLKILKEYDPKIIATMTYEDEGPNFVGADVFYSDYVYESIEYDYDEIIDMVIEGSETLTEESYDKDEQEWVDDEAQDTFHEEMWEVINDKTWNFCMEEVNYIKEHPEDFEE